MKSRYKSFTDTGNSNFWIESFTDVYFVSSYSHGVIAMLCRHHTVYRIITSKNKHSTIHLASHAS